MDGTSKRGIGVGIIVLFVFFGFVLLWVGISRGSEILLQFSLAVANLVMAGVIALQALATAESAEQVKKQAELMNESLLEMKKQRMGIEDFKNSLIVYLRHAHASIKSGNSVPNPYLYLIQQYRKGSVAKDLPPDELGKIWRISEFIKNFLSYHGVHFQEVEEYNRLLSKLNDTRTPSAEKPQIRRTIQEKTRSLSERLSSIFEQVQKMGEKELEDEILKVLES